ncbi:dTDP-4-dehydrorhamnose reductase [Bdellovibrio sp. HCB290]|uniref:dTDP-4-dehydrorhamnose reductase n=1 Tax=Bdellovibrio sp. HCB290 TaxID=3394356 RepID=UPI0039B5A371
MKKILIFGKNGQVAWELQRSCAVLGEIRACASDEVNLEDNSQVAEVIRSYKPDYIINAAAYTAVDKAETDEERATQINGTAVGVMADEAKRSGARFIHYSTDYVFDGQKEGAYTEKDVPNPLNAYGRSKLKGEQLIQEIGGEYLNLRVSWVYSNYGSNFYNTMKRLATEKQELSIVNDQWGAPTWSRNIADLTAQICTRDFGIAESGIFHLAPKGETTWFGFASEIFSIMKRRSIGRPIIVKNIKPILSSDYASKTVRPQNSRMNCAKLQECFGFSMPNWQDSLEDAYDEYYRILEVYGL